MNRALHDAIAAPEGWSALDPLSDRLRHTVHQVRPEKGRDLLYGVPFGHPLHPALVQIPLGCWVSAALLDLGPARRPAAVLVAAGTISALPAAVAGWVDWAELSPRQRRTGLVHALGNSAGLLCYAASLRARLTGRPMRGRLLGWAGLAVVSAAATIGGDLAHRQAAGANHTEAVPRLAPAEWTALGPVSDFPLDRPVRRMLDEVPVLVLRRADGFQVLADRCAHLSGSLSEGELVPEGPGAPADGCVRCPLHGSVFRLADGAVVHGPATADQPVFETRVLSDRLEVRAPR
ncbi:Rieske 2Fe-2S domain-containing protein [Kitasatospora sp. NPDC006697]|uniref:Rieske 2Fe-2S domain-containing protein n=1 Tax=Kitasatospora sp. NPDC006697 TaxID=3364020 RepID=UPI00368C03DF